MDDALRVRRIQRICDLDPQIERFINRQALARNSMLERLTFEMLHGDEGPPPVLADLIDGANAGMVQGGGGARFAPEALESRGVVGDFGGEKLEGHEAPQIDVFGLVHHTHPASAQLLDDAVVGDGPADQRRGIHDWRTS